MLTCRDTGPPTTGSSCGGVTCENRGTNLEEADCTEPLYTRVTRTVRCSMAHSMAFLHRQVGARQGRLGEGLDLCDLSRLHC